MMTMNKVNYQIHPTSNLLRSGEIQSVSSFLQEKDLPRANKLFSKLW